MKLLCDQPFLNKSPKTILTILAIFSRGTWYYPYTVVDVANFFFPFFKTLPVYLDTDVMSKLPFARVRLVSKLDKRYNDGGSEQVQYPNRAI